MRRSVLAAAAALLSAASAGAMPPPVPVAPTLVTTADDPGLAAQIAELLAKLDGGHYALRPEAISSEALAACKFDRPSACASAAIRERVGAATPTLALFVDHPRWRSAAVRVRCVGADATRAREIRLHVRDALRGTLDVDRAERSALATCLIGALHGTARKTEDF